MSDVHRDNPEATEREIEMIQLGRLVRAPRVKNDQDLERICRNCGDVFLIPDRLAMKTSKYVSLCPSCLMDEL